MLDRCCCFAHSVVLRAVPHEKGVDLRTHTIAQTDSPDSCRRTCAAPTFYARPGECSLGRVWAPPVAHPSGSALEGN